VLITQAGQGRFDRWAVLARPCVLPFGQDHALLKQRQDLDEVLLAPGLPAQDAARLLGFTAPLPISMWLA
jgi:hypothetical protein